MARTGYKKAKYNQIDIATNKYKVLTGSVVPSMKKVIDEKFAPEYNSAELYADDELAESDYSFKKGTLTITCEDDDDEIDAELLGNSITTDEVTCKTSDKAPEVGYGHIITKKVGSAVKYKVEFFPRVKFNKITTDAKTRGESIEFGTTTIEGVVKPLSVATNGVAVGAWEMHKTFDTEAAAETYLDTCLTPST